MSQYHQIFLHLVWSTKYRQPLIHPDMEGDLYQCMQDKCEDLSCKLLAVGGVEDHVHLLVQLHYTVPVYQLVKRIKGATTQQMKRWNQSFKWQRGYGVFSVAPRGIPKVSSYIANQKLHHGVGNLWNDIEQFDPTGE